MSELGHWAVNVLHADIDDYGLVAIVATLVATAAMVPQKRIRVPRSYGMALAGIGLLTAFFFLPAHMWQPLEHWGTGGRVVIPGFLLLLGLPSIDFRGARALLLVPALTVMLFARVELGRAMADFDRQSRHLDAVIAAMPADQRVMCLGVPKGTSGFRGESVLAYSRLLPSAQRWSFE